MGEQGTMFGLAAVPSPWPPSQTVELLAQNQDGVRVALAADTLGRFLV
jgi:hypothetical protein